MELNVIILNSNDFDKVTEGSYESTVLTFDNIDIAISIKGNKHIMLPFAYIIIDEDTIIAKSCGVIFSGELIWDNKEHTLAHCNLE